MVKSKADIMREYRQRLKEDPVKYELYLSQARQRKRKNYVPAASLSRKDRRKRNETNNKYLKKHRKAKKQHILEELARDNIAENLMETSGYETNQSADNTPLVVDMHFPNRRNGPRKRISRSLAKKSKELKKLKTDYEGLQTKYKRAMRSLQRLKKKSDTGEKDQCKENVPVDDSVQTPKTKTKRIMNEANLTRGQQAKVRKQILFGCLVQHQMRQERTGRKPVTKGALKGLISSDVLQKYRLKKLVSKQTGYARNRLGKSITCLIRRRQVRNHSKKVIAFLERDDNSRANPGKKDKSKANGETHQTRTLTDYLRNLHQKFLSENPDIKLSLTSFARIRPHYIKLTAFITRSACLCTKHQNMALCVRALRNNYGVKIASNPEEFVKGDDLQTVIESELPDAVKVSQWKRVPVEEKGRRKMVMKIVEHEYKKDEFIEFITQQANEFKLHVERVRRQYSEISQLKKHLNKDEVILHMDFAENYACKTVEEIQSAYWTQTGVTLHPIVAYFRDTDGNLTHQSIVVISNELAHNSSTVLAFLDHVMPDLKRFVPGLKRIHYWTDSPTSQYRNKTIFDVVARHEEIYGVAATWNYFESGHGKGPCDGLGGITKRMADEAVKSGKYEIDDAKKFFAWTESTACTMKSVNFKFVSTEECQKKANELSENSVKPVAGTMKMHAVVGGIEYGVILTANVSCYCDNCRQGVFCEGHWRKEHVVRLEKRRTVTNDEDNVQERRTITNDEDNVQEDNQENSLGKECPYDIGDHVAAKYLDDWFVGRIDDIDGNEYEINFMKTNKKCMTFQWPSCEDKIWIDKEDIMRKVEKPSATGRSQRAFKLKEEELKSIVDMFGQ